MKNFLISLLFLIPGVLPAQPVYDVVVYGGTPAGVMAAIQVARMGQTVALLEPGRHLGGIMVEGLGGTDIDNHQEFQNSPAVGGLALEFYRRIAKAYGRSDEFEQVLRSKAKKPDIWRFEPHVAEQILLDWVAEHKIGIAYESRLLEMKDAVLKKGTAIQQIKLENGQTYRAKVFIDATIEGDLLNAAGISTVIGRESNATYGEAKNGIQAVTDHAQFLVKVDPYRVMGDPTSGVIPTIQNEPLGTPGDGDQHLQAYCFRMCLTKNPTNRIPFPKPEVYQREQYEIYLRYLKAGGKLYRPRVDIPNGKTDLGAWHDLSHNLYGMNMAYPGGNYATRQTVLAQHRQFTQGLFYFLANDEEVGRLAPDLQKEWTLWGLSKDEFTDNGGWPRLFYVRDARRMVSDYVITEHHVRKGNPPPVPDPVAVAYWPPDIHSVRRIVKDGYAYNEGSVFRDNTWQPFGISYRALIPKASECTNLLTASCPSSSHIAYGAIRIEFTFMALGQACGTAAVLANQKRVTVQAVNQKELKDKLLADGQLLSLNN
ncbi:FAD-dependent oxidoreductase [Spirosoma endbachense]|uniref:FAD-dependent oxidoreductase n=1 Tax=Spirosoma endbachense TaxID=2666025 RepID=A0A6P1VWZ6_9BACT|nr:FAD-dependent oxidoreductase [Spirosoma endbachense]QHV96602.1 FAD-dependent oxidoreductase [Spirosoma endbachense]